MRLGSTLPSLTSTFLSVYGIHKWTDQSFLSYSRQLLGIRDFIRLFAPAHLEVQIRFSPPA